MEIRVLKYFLAVAREENITKAAEVLHITQPTLSRQLAQLEEDVGVSLFVRGSRKITLTDEGILLRRRAEEIISLVDKTRYELSEQEEHIDGTITIGCGELASMQTVAEIISSFKEKYPLVTYDLFTANADLVKEYIDKGLIDIGLLLEPISIDKYEFVRLQTKESWCVVIPTDDPLAQKSVISVEDLLGKTLGIPRRISIQTELMNWFGDYYDKMQFRFTYNFIGNGAIMVQNNLCYALTANGLIDNLWDKQKICTRPLKAASPMSTVLAWKRHQPFSSATTKFIEHIKNSRIQQ